MNDIDNIDIKKEIDNEWNLNILPTLCQYIQIPNSSPAFDSGWEKNGLIDDAINLVYEWICKQKINGLHKKIIRLEKTTPLIVCELPANTSQMKQSILFYGHLDKQPPQTEQWSDGLHPYKPIIRNGCLYGRGSADDGYSVFMIIILWKLLEKHKIPHGRFLLFAESSEESSSIDLPKYIDLLSDEKSTKIESKFTFGHQDLIICLDAGCDDYEKMYLTSSLRGCMTLDLNVTTLKKAIHSSNAGVVPDPFNVMREIIDRLIDKDGQFIKTMPDQDNKFLEKYTLPKENSRPGFNYCDKYPFLDEKKKEYMFDEDQMKMRRLWLPQLTLIGLDGIPNRSQSGNIISPNIIARFSMRLPPQCLSSKVFPYIKEILETDPPKGSEVKLDLIRSSEGWLMPYNERLMNVINIGTNNNWSFRGAGGSIPFMNHMTKKFPKSNFIVTGVLGPNSNAHGPDECLNIDYAKKLTCWLYQIILDI